MSRFCRAFRENRENVAILYLQRENLFSLSERSSWEGSNEIRCVFVQTPTQFSYRSIEHAKVLCDSLGNLRLILRPSLVFLVSTIGRKGGGKQYLNLAPYSLVMEASHIPPRVLIGVRHSNDTYINILKTEEFVLNLCSPENLDLVKICAKKTEYGVSEVEVARRHANCTITPYLPTNISSSVPGILETPVSIWCRLIKDKSITFSEKCYREEGERTVFLADVVGLVANREHLSPYQDRHRLNPEKEILLSYGADTYGTTQVKKGEQLSGSYSKLQEYFSQVHSNEGGASWQDESSLFENISQFEVPKL